MTKLPGFFISKVFSILLILLLLDGPVTLAHPAGEDIQSPQDNFAAALSEYHNHSYHGAAEKLEQVLDLKEELDSQLKAKAYLLLGACYEKLKKEEKAGISFSRLKELLDKKLINQVPAVAGIKPADFPSYREVFAGESFFTYNEPIPVSEIMKKNVVHAPRKSIKEKEKEKKKKKFPWLIAVVAVVIVGIAAVLLLTQKSNDKESQFTEIEWMQIPAGEFLMGDNFNEGDNDELPVHEVYLKEYYISKYEINTGQYNFFCEDTGREKLTVVVPRFAEYAGRYPANKVTYHDAVAFCNWLSQKIGKYVHLPTEAQWEKAARSDLQYRYPWGNSAPDCGVAFFNECLENEFCLDGQLPVHFLGSGDSPYNVYNMAGNAWEWCQDWYSESYYALSPENNPTGPASGSYRVIRGGCGFSPAYELRSANREYFSPGLRLIDIGFRVVMEEE